jgi:signal transduction histidine kinase
MPEKKVFPLNKGDISWRESKKLISKKWFAIISRVPYKPNELIIEQASPMILLENEDIIGQICYKRFGGFSKPCPDCPVLKAWEDRQIHMRDVVHIMPSQKIQKNKSTHQEQSSIDVLHMTVIAVPIRNSEDGKERAIEFYLGRTQKERREHQTNIEAYQLEQSLTDIIEKTDNNDFIKELISFGIITIPGFKFEEAYMLSPDSVSGISLHTMIKQTICMPYGDEGLKKARSIHRAHFSNIDEISRERLRADIINISDRNNDVNKSLFECLSKITNVKLDQIRSELELPIAFRIHQQWAIVPVLKSHSEIFGLLLVKSRENTLISNNDLEHLSTFSAIISYSLSRRDLLIAYNNTVKGINQLSKQFGSTSADMLFMGGIISGLGHDLLRANNRLKDLGDMLIPEISLEKRNSERLKPIITEYQNLLDFQGKCLERIIHTSRASKPNFFKNNIEEIITDVIKTYQHTLEDNNITIAIVNKVKDTEISCDKFLIRQVFTNLVDNSIYWLRGYKKKIISIELSQINNDNILIIFKDTGPGIAENIRKEVWKPLFTIKPGGGIGLGLYIVNRIMEAHHGSITAKWEHGWGANFHMLLPIMNK